MDDRIPFLDTTGTQFDSADCEKLLKWAQSSKAPWVQDARGVRKCLSKDIPQDLLKPFTNEVKIAVLILTGVY